MKSTLELDPEYAEAYFGMGITYTVMKRYDDAIPALKTALRLSGNRLVMLSMLGMAEGLAGRKDETRKIYYDLKELSAKTHVSPYYFAILEIGLGNVNKAIDDFYKAYNERDGILIFSAIDPIAESAWSDPRFVALLKKMGMQKY